MCISRCWKKSMSYVEGGERGGVGGEMEGGTTDRPTSLEVKGTTIPTAPERVVYTNSSDPPGMRVVLWRELMVSPIWKWHSNSACGGERVGERD